MVSILTNSRVAATMSELELRARAGDLVAQELLEKECSNFSKLVLSDAKMGMDMQERNKLLRK